MLQLFGEPISPNYLRASIVAREKGVDFEFVNRAKAPDFDAINPLGQIPALKFDDGAVLTESLVIARYLDEISPAPSLFGETEMERARIGMWERRAETLIFNPAVEYGHHTHPFFAQFLTQHSKWAADLIPKAKEMSQLAQDQLGKSDFLAGEHFSIADITLYLGWLLFDGHGGLPFPNTPPAKRWREALEERPSFAETDALKLVLQMSTQPS